MTINFTSKLENINYIQTEDNEIIITDPEVVINSKIYIRSPCKISSNCNTIIKCTRLVIKSKDVSISDIFFKSPIKIKESENISISNCTTDSPETENIAIQISKSKSVSIKDTTITKTGKFPGFLIESESIVSASNITVHDIDTTLIACFNKSKFTVTDSTFHHSAANGILADDQSYVEITNSTFSDMACPAIFIENSKCLIKNNKIKNVEQNALSLNNCQDFLVEKNEFTSIQATAISISGNSKGKVNANNVYEINGNAILCTDKCDVVVSNNTIHNLSYPSISIAMNAKALIVGNKIDKIKYSGIAIRQAKHVKIIETEISNVCESGISVSDTECCLIENNKISNCEVASIESYNKSRVFASENIITNIGKYAFLAYTSGFIKAERNMIDNVKNAMVKLAYKGGGDFINNKVSNCPLQCECHTSSFYYINKNGSFQGVTNDSSRKTDDISIESPCVENDLLCLKCNKNKRDYFLLDCGHKVYCKECAEEAFRNKEECPLCRFPIEKVTNGFGASNEDMCLICCEKLSNCIILPCGHMGICSECMENWFSKKKSCPICRSEPSFYKEIQSEISS